MSRSGYNDDSDDQWAAIRWRGAVTSAIRGKKGQAFLKELAAAMDAMIDKALIAEELIESDGRVCALGAVGKARGIDMTHLDPEEYYDIARAFGIPEALAREIMYENDEIGGTPERRWQYIRNWVQYQIIAEVPVDATPGH